MTHPAVLHAMSEETQRNWYETANSQAAHAFAKTPIFIFTVGKVGSSTIYASLKKTPLAAQTFHMHALRADNLVAYREVLHRKQSPVPFHVYSSEALIKQMELHPERGIKIISLVREPVSREISSLFENKHLFRHMTDEEGRIIPERATSVLASKFLNGNPCAEMMNWFSYQLEPVFHIDVLKTPFPKPRQSQVYRHGPHEMLMLRLEDLSSIGSEVLGEFLGLPEPLPLVKSRVRDDDVYDEVKANLRIPANVCDEIYSHPVMKHFYTEQELSKFHAKWSLDVGNTEATIDYIKRMLLSDIEAREEWTVRTVTELSDKVESQQQEIAALSDTLRLSNQHNERLSRFQSSSVQYLKHRVAPTAVGRALLKSKGIAQRVFGSSRSSNPSIPSATSPSSKATTDPPSTPSSRAA